MQAWKTYLNWTRAACCIPHAGLTRRCCTAVFPSEPAGLQERRCAALEGWVWKRLCSASCWLGSFGSTVDRGGRRKKELNRLMIQRRVKVILTKSFTTSLPAFQSKENIWWKSTWTPPCFGQFIFSYLEDVWNVHTAHGRARLHLALNVGGPPPSPFHLLQNQIAWL